MNHVLYDSTILVSLGVACNGIILTINFRYISFQIKQSMYRAAQVEGCSSFINAEVVAKRMIGTFDDEPMFSENHYNIDLIP
jgi:hypothetical protein